MTNLEVERRKETVGQVYEFDLGLEDYQRKVLSWVELGQVENLAGYV